MMNQKRKWPFEGTDGGGRAGQPAFFTWADGDEQAKSLALNSALSGLKKAEPVVRQQPRSLSAQGSSLYLNVVPGSNISVRDEFSRGDYEDFRLDEALPRRPKDIIAACMAACRRSEIARNFVELMTDFGVQGIDLVHTSEGVQRFYKEWFRQVRGRDVSGRFLGLFYRAGLAVGRRQTGKITKKEEQRMKRARPSFLTGSSLLPLNFEPAEGGPAAAGGGRPKKREIPVLYTFYDPRTLDVMGESLACALGPTGIRYSLRLPADIVRAIKSPKNGLERELVSMLPRELTDGVKSGKQSFPLDPEDTFAFYYKKDDWQAWPEPMLYPVLADLQLLEKMKLADLAALDGAISSIRVWKIGSLEHKILPSEATITRLAEMLANNVGGGVMDLVWGPDIELVETSTSIHQFLGEAKYGACLSLIYQGLGIPQTLTGAGGKERGFSSSFFGLKTLIERLEYGRQALREFWEKEIRLVQEAMGFREPAQLVFDRMTLNDESSEKKLLLDLADRNIVSDESLQEWFGLCPEIEEVRLRRESRKRDRGSMPQKVSPYHDAQQEYGLKKILAQSGAYTPEQLGVGLEEDTGKDGPIPVKKVADAQPPKPPPGGGGGDNKKKGVSGQGRPLNSKDSSKRKKKKVSPRTSAVKACLLEATAASLAATDAASATAAPTDDELDRLAELLAGLLGEDEDGPITPGLILERMQSLS